MKQWYLLFVWSALAASKHGLLRSFISCEAATHNDTSQPPVNSPGSLSPNNRTIYTYFEHMEQSELVTGMSREDHEALLDLWKTTWAKYGWDPVILTNENVERHPDYFHFHQRLQRLHLDSFGEVLFHRWFAMVSVGGGWFADYDVFPIKASNDDNFGLALPSVMTVFDIIAPTLAAGEMEHWNMTLNHLLNDAIQNTVENDTIPTPKQFHFWTDALGILNLLRDYKLPSIRSERRVALPYGQKDPLFSDTGCDSKPFRGRWAVHFGPEVLQSAPNIPPEKRHPKYRAQLAKEWLDLWESKCLSTKLKPQ
jgi:hypothetical protein